MSGFSRMEQEMLSADDWRRRLVGELRGLAGSGRHDAWRVFSDFVQVCALTMSNHLDWAQVEQREAEYLGVMRRYQPEEQQALARMFGMLVMTLEAQEEVEDVLGRVYMELELGNKYAGQFFTPPGVCRLMAQMMFADGVWSEAAAERGFVTVCEPCCGGGAMLLAALQELRAAGVNYQRDVHVSAMDIDAKAVWMTYVQLSLLHVPAVVVCGNALSMEIQSWWYTPAHVRGGWGRKLADQGTDIRRLPEAMAEAAEARTEAAEACGQLLLNL